MKIKLNTSDILKIELENSDIVKVIESIKDDIGAVYFIEEIYKRNKKLPYEAPLQMIDSLFDGLIKYYKDKK